ncbi:hypothetical protein ASswx1_114 [Aeromonas phage Asswx_1]|uniref:Uncharacterized protein n=1 Tax=Aeromonas phage Asswx_1 TaxID=2419739 RepID=A0A411B829_9CAUD|nr:hypothetical protein ASswx1_114 [Aeromonas phage Asswx_1]QAX99182.1 hypothetical protein assk_403 [Aeromonas phage Assk]
MTANEYEVNKATRIAEMQKNADYILSKVDPVLLPYIQAYPSWCIGQADTTVAFIATGKEVEGGVEYFNGRTIQFIMHEDETKFKVLLSSVGKPVLRKKKTQLEACDAVIKFFNENVENFMAVVAKFN